MKISFVDQRTLAVNDCIDRVAVERERAKLRKRLGPIAAQLVTASNEAAAQLGKARDELRKAAAAVEEATEADDPARIVATGKRYAEAKEIFALAERREAGQRAKEAARIETANSPTFAKLREIVEDEERELVAAFEKAAGPLISRLAAVAELNNILMFSHPGSTKSACA